MFHLRKSRLLPLFVAILLGALLTQQVLAHAKLLRSDPADGTVLPESPALVHLWFNEAISPQFSTARILNVNGQEIPLDGIRADSDDPTMLVLTLPPLEDGIYSVNWHVLSQVDGHFTQGLVVFGVGENVTATGAGEAEEPPPPPQEVILRWLNYSVLMLITGGVTLVAMVLPPHKQDYAISRSRWTVRKWILGALLVITLVGIVVGFGWLYWQADQLLSTLPEGVTQGAVLKQMLGETRWGYLWIIRQLILVGLGLLLGSLWHLTKQKPDAASMPGSQLNSTVLFLSVVLTLGLNVVQGLNSHAAALLKDTGIAIVSDILHLVAAGMWVGGMSGVFVGLVMLLREGKEALQSLARSTWTRFSRYAALSVGLIFATGFYNTAQQVDTLDAMLTTDYGRALTIKILLAVVISAFGALNGSMLHPCTIAPLAKALKRKRGWTILPLQKMHLTVASEALIGFIIILTVSLMTSSAPAKGPEYTIVADELPEAKIALVDDLFITFSAKPNRPGQNLFEIPMVSTRKPIPSEILRVILRFEYDEQDLGWTEADADLYVDDEYQGMVYRTGGGNLSLPGDWKVQVIVRRKGMQDTVAAFDWTVAPAGEAREVIVSNRPIKGWLTWSAIGTAMIIVSAIIGFTASKKPFPCGGA